MAIKKFKTEFGVIEARNVVLDAEFDEVVEGLELLDEDNTLIEVQGYVDLESADSKKIETIYKQNINNGN